MNSAVCGNFKKFSLKVGANPQPDKRALSMEASAAVMGLSLAFARQAEKQCLPGCCFSALCHSLTQAMPRLMQDTEDAVHPQSDCRYRLTYPRREILIRGAIAASRRLGVSPLLTGLVIVGFGTSAPELVVSIDAALNTQPDIAVGNILGSNIFNLLATKSVNGEPTTTMLDRTAHWAIYLL